MADVPAANAVPVHEGQRVMTSRDDVERTARWIVGNHFGAHGLRTFDTDSCADAVVDTVWPIAQAAALREAAERFAAGEWADAWMADGVDDDVSAVQSTARWFLAEAERLEQSADG